MIRLGVTAFVLFAATADADTPAERATWAAETLRSAGEMVRTADRAADKVAALSKAVGAYEDGLSELRHSLRDATLRSREIEAELAQNRQTIGRYLSALVTMGRAPDAQAATHPKGALATLRAGMILSDLTPALEARIEGLNAQIAELDALKAVESQGLATLRAGLAEAETARSAFVLAAATKTPVATAADEATLRAILEGAETLAAFADNLGSASASDGSFAAERGQLPSPAKGRIKVPYLGEDDQGVRRQGILLATDARATVTSPAPATVRYAGPFLDLGLVVILEPQAGYLIALGGLEETYVNLGEVLDKGALVGMMGGKSPNADEILIEITDAGGHDRTETLYVEVRYKEETLDPEEWFGFEKD